MTLFSLSDESMSESSEISDAEVQPKPILQQPKVS